jgi:trk system potassium uptake protein TrkH
LQGGSLAPVPGHSNLRAIRDNMPDRAGLGLGFDSARRRRPVERVMHQTIGSVTTYPARASLAWYLGLITVGSILLVQAMSHGNPSAPISWLDAAFTATSAACVTGLSVRSTEFDFSRTGQIIILVLIQLGGIGIMTVTTLIMYRLRRGSGLRARAVVAETLGADENMELSWVLTRVILLTFTVEGIGFVILTLRNLFHSPWQTAMWEALFHSISAFCNAGFSVHHTNLERYQSDIVVNLTIGGLIVVGGIGYPVILDLLRSRRGKWSDRWNHLHLHSKLMLIGTGTLLMLGTLTVLVLEWDGVLREMPIWQRFVAAFFHSVSCRTAGYNTVNIGALTNATLFISILLMAVGAGPCSTGGGFKVSTLMILIVQALSTFRGRRRVKAFRRTIPRPIIDRATATAMLFTVVAAAALTILLVIEQSSTPHFAGETFFLDVMFEVVSALGTVGLSTGITAQLSDVGQVVLIILMLLGRLGPISVFVALSRREVTDPVVFPDEEPLIG